MEIKINFKPIENEIINEFEESVKLGFSKLSENEKVDLKHRIMNMKMQTDLIEKELKAWTIGLQELLKPKKEEVKKEVKPVEEPKTTEQEDVMEIDL